MLDWIDENSFDFAVQNLKHGALDALANAEKRRRKNVVDPFHTLLLASTFDVKASSNLVELQQAESAIRGMSGSLGTFHQSILGSVGGWQNHDALYDLKNEDRKIVAEVKNKWNTMNTANRRQIESDLDTSIRSLRGNWTAYLVLVIPRKPDRYRKAISKGVFETDGASFYHLATGYPNAIHDLFDALVDALAPSNEIGAYCRAILEQTLPPRIQE